MKPLFRVVCCVLCVCVFGLCVCARGGYFRQRHFQKKSSILGTTQENTRETGTTKHPNAIQGFGQRIRVCYCKSDERGCCVRNRCEISRCNQKNTPEPGNNKQRQLRPRHTSFLRIALKHCCKSLGGSFKQRTMLWAKGARCEH